jgi:hypothetical protein
MRGAFLAGFAAFVVTLVASHFRSTPYDNYVLFADALAHGRLWIEWPGPYIDAVLGPDGHRYIVNDPLPALLLLPAVIVAGKAANQTFLAVILCAVACGAAWSLCRRLGASVAVGAWLVAFLLAGTDLLWCSMLGDVWFIAQTCAVCFTLLALVELAGKSRAWLVMLFFLCAVASRFTMVMALPVIAYLIVRGGLRIGSDDWFPQRLPERTRRAIVEACAVFAPACALWVAYNLARWGVPWDAGHTIFYHQDAAGSPAGSPFGLEHVGYQLSSFFLARPTITDHAPWFIPEYGGVALTWTSPALVIAFLVRRPRPVVAAMWAAAALIAVPNLLYYVNGTAQFGMRHALDFEPFLFVLMALALRSRMPVWGGVLIAFSAAAGLWGTWYWNTFYRPGY